MVLKQNPSLTPDSVEGSVVDVGWEGVGVTGHVPDNIGVSRHTPTEEGVARPFWVVVTFEFELVRINCGGWNIALTADAIIIV